MHRPKNAHTRLTCLAVTGLLSLCLSTGHAQIGAQPSTETVKPLTPARLDPNTDPMSPPRDSETGQGAPTGRADLMIASEPGVSENGNLPGWATEDLPQDRDHSTTELFVRSMGALLIVIALIVAVLSLSKRIMPRLVKNAGKEIKIVETTMLGPRKYLHVIEVANQRLLLGSTNDRINMLAHLVDNLAGLDIEPGTENKET